MNKPCAWTAEPRRGQGTPASCREPATPGENYCAHHLREIMRALTDLPARTPSKIGNRNRKRKKS